MGYENGRSPEYNVWGTIEVRPPVPLARLRGLTDQEAFQRRLGTAPAGAAGPEPASAPQARWEFVPDDDAGTDDTDDQGRPRAIKYLRVNDQGVARTEVDRRLLDVAALVGTDHTFHGHLRYEGYVGDEGEIRLRGGGPPQWRDTTPRYW